MAIANLPSAFRVEMVSRFVTTQKIHTLDTESRQVF